MAKVLAFEINYDIVKQNLNSLLVPLKCIFDLSLKSGTFPKKMKIAKMKMNIILFKKLQGSILGPSLFLLYVNDIHYASKVLNPIMFVDDTSLLFSHSDINVGLMLIRYRWIFNFFFLKQVFFFPLQVIKKRQYSTTASES